jgi:hypothetical protein
MMALCVGHVFMLRRRAFVPVLSLQFILFFKWIASCQPLDWRHEGLFIGERTYFMLRIKKPYHIANAG